MLLMSLMLRTDSGHTHEKTYNFTMEGGEFFVRDPFSLGFVMLHQVSECNHQYSHIRLSLLVPYHMGENFGQTQLIDISVKQLSQEYCSRGWDDYTVNELEEQL